MDNGEVPLGIFIDLSKAFDTLDHDILLRKLKYYGLTGISLKLFKSYLTNRKQFVNYNSVNSDLLTISTGVPQGSILGPLLFLIYMNDIHNATNLFHFILFADDTTLITKNGVNKSNIINAELAKLSLWFKVNKLSLNLSKSKFIVFRQPQKKITEPIIKIDDNIIDCVDNFNFLGLIINKHLNWKKHIEHISLKISRIIGVLTRLRHLVPLDVLHLLYNSLLLPHINYSLLAWGHQPSKITNLQKKCLRIITNSK